MIKDFVKSMNKVGNAFFSSNLFCLFMFALSVWVIITGEHVGGLLVTVLVMIFILVMCDDIKTTTVPFLCASVFLSQCYDSYDTFIKYVWIAPPVIIAMLYNFIAYRKRLVIGKTFYGICAVAVSVTLGGLGSISFTDYFAGASIYAVAGLGVGMMFAYVIVKSRYVDSEDRSAFSALARAMYLMGLLVCFLVLWGYADRIYFLLDKFAFPLVRSSNNYATFLMFALPFPFYYSIKNKLHLPVAFFMFGCLLLVGSRGGILLGTVEFFVCLLAMIYCDKRYRLFYIILSVLGIVAGVMLSEQLIRLCEIDGSSLTSSTQARSKLLNRAYNDFITSPILGKGLGYKGNVDVYNPVKGALPWYHMMIPQVFASLGLVGVVAYVYQFFTRARALIQKLSPVAVILALSYFGVLIMSQVNPGEFCPIPYELLAVMIFAVMENMPGTSVKFGLGKIKKKTISSDTKNR